MYIEVVIKKEFHATEGQIIKLLWERGEVEIKDIAKTIGRSLNDTSVLMQKLQHTGVVTRALHFVGCYSYYITAGAKLRTHGIY